MNAPRRVPALALLAAVIALVLAGCGRGSSLDAASDHDPGRSAPSASASPHTKKSHPPKKDPTAAPSGSPAGSPLPSISIPKITLPPSSRGLVVGGDASWPQCPKGMGIPHKRTLGLPMPSTSSRFVLLGLTNGPAFHANPCLASQVQWVAQRHLMAAAYAVHSYPDAGTLAAYGDRGPYDGGSRLGALSNVGYQQARFNLATMNQAGLVSPVVWLDVEPVPFYDWSKDVRANAAVVVGAARAYSEAGYQVGVYSTPLLWEGVVGALHLGLPEWRAAGQTSRAEALRRCAGDWVIQGGDAVLGQWVEDGHDVDITCPGTAAQMYRWFHQY